MANDTGVIRITVTADDVANGLRSDTHECPIARAVRRLFPNASVSVGVRDIAVIDYEHGYSTMTYNLPPRARDFVFAFDNESSTAKPFRFSTRPEKQQS